MSRDCICERELNLESEFNKLDLTRNRKRKEWRVRGINDKHLPSSLFSKLLVLDRLLGVESLLLVIVVDQFLVLNPILRKKDEVVWSVVLICTNQVLGSFFGC